MFTLFSYLVGLFLLAVIVASVMSLYVIWKNDLPLNAPPGTIIRLQTYLSTHVAETADDSPYPELKPLRINADPEQLSATIKQLIKELGWELLAEKEAGAELHAVITTEKMKFKDDLMITISSLEEGHSEVNMHSESRTGRADFGTNLRHILDLKQALLRVVE